jgi:hypothetical protein
LVNPNERQATLNSLIWGAALREMPFLHAASLFLTDVQQAHGTQNALQRIKNGYFATARISVNRP